MNTKQTEKPKTLLEIALEEEYKDFKEGDNRTILMVKSNDDTLVGSLVGNHSNQVMALTTAMLQNEGIARVVIEAFTFYLTQKSK